MSAVSNRSDGLERGRDGDLVPAELEHDCIDGWRGEDHAGRRCTCLVCRPHLRRRPLAGYGPSVLSARPNHWKDNIR